MGRTRVGTGWHDCRGTVLSNPLYIAILGMLMMTIGARRFVSRMMLSKSPSTKSGDVLPTSVRTALVLTELPTSLG